MSQTTIQENKKKQLTFEEICPYHACVLSAWNNLSPKNKLIEHYEVNSVPASCIVGEAYGFKDYSRIPDSQGNLTFCTECVRFGGRSSGFPTAFFKKKNIDINWEKFEEIKSGFVEHWNNHHVNKL